MSRNPIFDIMKGIAILLVILGHESWVSGIPSKIIFAFHMPLFFLVAGYFYKGSNIKKDFKRLVVPYLFTGGLLMVYHILVNLPSFSFPELKRDILNVFWGSGSPHSAALFGDKPCIGAIWFLLALFWCKTIYGVIKTRMSSEVGMFLTVGCLSITAILLDRYVVSLPLTILPGCAAVIFFYFGDCIKGGVPTPIALVFIISYCVSVLCQPLVCMVNCYYRFYPLTIFGGIGGTILIYLLSTRVTKVKHLNSFLSWIGSISLPILCFHLFQLNTSFLKPSNKALAGISAFVFPIVAAILCTKIKPLRCIFGIRDSYLLFLSNKL